MDDAKNIAKIFIVGKIPEFQNLSGGFEVTLIGLGKSFEEEIERQKFHKLDINERQRKAVEFVKSKGKRHIYSKRKRSFYPV